MSRERHAPRELAMRPTCDRCSKPVESFVEVFDEVRRYVRFVARCHGEREVVDVEQEVLEDRTPMRFTRAFVRPPLLGGTQ